MTESVTELKKEIDKFLKLSRMSTMMFSFRAANERNFCHRLQKGYQPNERQIAKVRAFIKRHTARIERKKVK